MWRSNSIRISVSSFRYPKVARFSLWDQIVPSKDLKKPQDQVKPSTEKKRIPQSGPLFVMGPTTFKDPKQSSIPPLRPRRGSISDQFPTSRPNMIRKPPVSARASWGPSLAKKPAAVLSPERGKTVEEPFKPQRSKWRPRKLGVLDSIHRSVDEMVDALKQFRELIIKHKSSKKVSIKSHVLLTEASQILSVPTKDLFKLSRRFDYGAVRIVGGQEYISGRIMMKICDALDVPYEDSREVIETVQRERGKAVPRPPIVSVMGHVDHGKTTLLDFFRSKKVAPTEAGGITQCIGSFQIDVDVDGHKRPITFFDTPGHSVFTSMRETIARVSDIVIVVIDVNEGVQQQTVEVLKLLQIYSVPMLIAVTKCDDGNGDTKTILSQLRSHNIVLEDDGGDVQVVKISAKTGKGIPQLMEALALSSEIVEPKTYPDGDAEVIVVETDVQKGLGHLVHAVVTNGVLKTGDFLQGQNVDGSVKTILNQYKKPIKVADASTPVTLKGFDTLPEVGETLYVSGDAKTSIVGLEEKKQVIEEVDEKFKVVNFILKADQSGTLSSIEQYIARLPKRDLLMRIIHAEVGAVNADDVKLAASSGAVVLAFNVGNLPEAKKMLKNVTNQSVQVISSNLAYDLCDKVNQLFLDNVSDDVEIIKTGTAQVLMTFSIDFKESGPHNIAGARVDEGSFFHEEGALVKVIRDSKMIAEEPMRSLRRFKDPVLIVEQGLECGIALETFQDFQKGDMLICVRQKRSKMSSGELFKFVDSSRVKELEKRQMNA